MRVDRALFEVMVAEVAVHAAPFTSVHGSAIDGVHMLGTSGTVTTIAGIHLNLPRYDRRRVDGCWLSDTEVSGVIDRLLAMAGSDKTRILKANIWLSDIRRFDEMNAVWDGWVAAGQPPARATVEARLAGPGYLVEIMVEAALDG